MRRVEHDQPVAEIVGVVIVDGHVEVGNFLVAADDARCLVNAGGFGGVASEGVIKQGQAAPRARPTIGRETEPRNRPAW